ncbi:MAG: hypothetical protein ACE5FU_13750 [Nitrospinota bacterium]
MEVIGVQQVLSLSSAAEKVQQTTQQRPDVVSHDAIVSRQEEEAERSMANPPSELTQETKFQRESENKKGNRRRLSKKKGPELEEDVSVKVVSSSDYGNVVDLRV